MKSQVSLVTFCSFILFCLALSGAGAQSTPVIQRLEPHTVIVGGGAFTLGVIGTGFTSNSVVRFNGANRTTTFISSTRLNAQITAADSARAGTVNITVLNPPNTASAAQTLSIAKLNFPWLRTAGPEAGVITALLSAGNLLLAGTDVNGVLRSTDQGQTWNPPEGDFTDASITALAESDDVLLAGSLDDGILRSTDQGKRWTASNAGLEGAASRLYITALAATGATVYATIGTRVFRSTDKGQNWTALNASTVTPPATALALLGAQLFVGTAGGVYRYDTATQLWALVNNGLPNDRVRALAVLGNQVFVLLETAGLFRSGDQGANWLASNTGLPAERGTALRVQGADLLCGTEGGDVYRSTDAGQSWRPEGGELAPVRVLALAQQGDFIFAGTDGSGVYRVQRGRNWASANNGIKSSAIAALAESGGQVFAGLLDGGIARLAEDGRNWLPLNNGLANRQILSMAGNGAQLFAGTKSGGLFRSTDNGANWRAVGSLRGKMVTKVAFARQVVFAQADGTLYRSTNNGDSWSAALQGLPLNVVVHDFAAVGGTIFAALDRGVFRSTDNGARWISSSHLLPLQPILSFAVVGSTLYCGTGPFDNGDPGGLYRSTNGGGSWSQVRAAVSVQQNSRVKALKMSGNKMLALIGRGQATEHVTDSVYLSADEGRNWEQLTFGLPSLGTSELAAKGAAVFLGTNGNGVFTNNLSGAAVATVSAASFSSFTLSANSIAAAFGTELATATEVAATQPLPTQLAGTRVTIRDSAGDERLAPLFFVSPGQINFLVPAGTAVGTAIISVSSSNGKLSAGVGLIANVAPGLFAANANGQGVPAAVALRIEPDGALHYEAVARYDEAQKKFVPLPLDLGAENEQVFLILFGTGFRARTNLTAVTAQVGGIAVPVVFAGAQGGLTGLDQMNLRLPHSLSGKGEVDVVAIVDGASANTVRIKIK